MELLQTLTFSLSNSDLLIFKHAQLVPRTGPLYLMFPFPRTLPPKPSLFSFSAQTSPIQKVFPCPPYKIKTLPPIIAYYLSHYPGLFSFRAITSPDIVYIICQLSLPLEYTLYESREFLFIAISVVPRTVSGC